MSQTQAEAEYQEAQRRIRVARESGATELSLSRPYDLECLPPELGELTALTSLNLSGCIQLKDLRPLAGLATLTSLDLSWCEQLTDLSPLAGLTALTSLQLNWCRQLTDLSPLAGLTALTSLSLLQCEKLTDLRHLNRLTALTHFGLSNCKQLTDLSPLRDLSSLAVLYLNRCEQLTDLRSLSGLTELTDLDLSECHQLADVGSLAKLTALTRLNLSSCWSLADLNPIAGLTALTFLELSGCGRLTDLGPLASLTSLADLSLYGHEQITDLSALAGLTALRSLYLGRCEQLADLRPLAALTALTSLDLRECGQIADLTPLAGLTALTSLDLYSCVQLADLRPLAALTALTRLDLNGCKQIADLTPLAGLTAVTSLNLCECEQISDLTPLAGITTLTSLDVGRCTQITDLTSITSLTALTSLDLRGCKQIADLTPLAGLTALTSLNLRECEQISDLTPLAGLTTLTSLDVGRCTQITDLTSITSLTALTSLDLRGCQQIMDLAPITGLTGLRRLCLNYCRGRLEPLERLLPTLEGLYLFSSQFEDLPAEVCGEHIDENVIDKVRAHYADLERGEARGTEVKVLVLGNGGAGKTQLVRRMKGERYDESIASTHGIQLSELDVTLESEEGEREVRLNVWDFGGQEIYHGAHALFVQGHAVFVILWTPALEDKGAYEENGIPMRHRPLAYWLDYVKAFAGTDAPVVVVQSQCDTANQRVRPLPGTQGSAFANLQATQASAKTGLGLDQVRAAVKEAVRDCLAHRPMAKIGANRARVRDEVRRLLKEDLRREPARRTHRLMERAEFNVLCERERIASSEALLDYLNLSGALIYRSGLFGGRILLDQNWALEGVYVLFERTATLPWLRERGRFTRADLAATIWRDYTVDEQRLFLQLMQSCGMCFRAREIERNEWEYLAPELLPKRGEARRRLLAGRLGDEPATALVEASYPFLHEGVMRAFLAKIGERAGAAAEYWRYGCWFYEETTRSRALIEAEWTDAKSEAGPGTVRMSAWGAGARALLEPLAQTLRELPIGHRPEIRWRGTEASTAPYDVRTERDALKDLRIVEPMPAERGLPMVYVSYAWGDDQSEAGREREAAVDELCKAAESEGWEVVRDRDRLTHGDLISTFMKSLTRSDVVIVVLSEKYLRSPYCLTELHGLYQRSQGDKAEFLGHVLPFTLGDARYGTLRDQVEHAKHWEREVAYCENHFKLLGRTGNDRYRAMRDWANHVVDMLAYVNDKLHPRGFAEIVKDDCAALREQLRKRLSGPCRGARRSGAQA